MSLIERLRQLARRQRQYGAAPDEKIDVTCDLAIDDLDEAATQLEAMQAEIDRLREDGARLDFLQNDCNDLRCFSIPTGGGDADVGWRVIGHYMAEPQERVMGEVWHDNLREAIDQAMDRSAPPARASLDRQGK